MQRARTAGSAEEEMNLQPNMSKAFVRGSVLALALSGVLGLGWAGAQTATSNDFVQKDGTKLTLGGETFRYSGPNIEWLGLEAYGPHDPLGPRFANHAEIDDAFDTAAMMGAKVVRSQTMGDTVGCPECIEPEEGKFNDAGFQATDYAVATAKKHGIKLIVTMVGDCATCNMGGIGQYLAWEKKQNPQDFFTDPAMIAAFEKHIDAVLNHVNPLTGVAYKNDPTIMAWENCNMCGLVSMFLGGSPASMAQVSDWVETIGEHIKSVDNKHLYLDTSGLFRYYPKVLDSKSVDMTTLEYYPHWDKLFGQGKVTTTAETFSQDAATITGHGKVYIINEFGWDVTDWPTQADLQKVLDTLANDKNISGDDFWALQAHNANFGWQPIPANVDNAAYARTGESGQWWALYYGGIKTMIISKADMRERAEMLRNHAFAMRGIPVPPHPVPAAPVITANMMGLVSWRGSAGAVSYSVQRQTSATAPWETICDKCATDEDTPWADPKPVGLFGSHYRVIAYNADGVASEPSAAR